MSGCILHLSSSHSPVFLINSCLDLFSAPPSLEDPLSRSYGVSLPNSLTVSLPTPQYILPNYLCRFAVRVPYGIKLSGFSREYDYLHYLRVPGEPEYYRDSDPGVDLPAPVDSYTLQRRIPDLRGSVTAPSPHPCQRKLRNINRMAIGLAVRLILRTRLTPG